MAVNRLDTCLILLSSCSNNLYGQRFNTCVMDEEHTDIHTDKIPFVT